MTLLEVARELTDRLAATFLLDSTGSGLCSAAAKVSGGPAMRDHILFYEYFHGDNGAGAPVQVIRRVGRAS